MKSGVLAAIALVVAAVLGAGAGYVVVSRGERNAGLASPPPQSSPATVPTGQTSSGIAEPTPTGLHTVGFPTDQPTGPTATDTPAPPPADYPAVLGRVRSGTVRVLASTCSGTGIGTGFLLDGRTVLTALPTIARAVSVVVVVGGRPVPAVVQSESPKIGYASLRLSRAVPGHQFDAKPVTGQVGATLAVIGVEAERRGPTLRTAVVESTGETASGNQVSLGGLIGLSGTADPGLSGAPLVNGEGRVAGMIVTPEGEGRLKAIPSELLFTLDGGDDPDPGSCGKPLGPQIPTTIRGVAPAAVKTTLRRYFGGINQGDFDKVYAAVEPGVLRGSRSDVEKGFRSTYDFNIRIRAAQGPNAWVTFDSIFATGRGPERKLTCARWSRVFIFNETGGRTRISRVENRGPLYRPC
jgi:hypothetical protein